jgi:hypothetical protein
MKAWKCCKKLDVWTATPLHYELEFATREKVWAGGWPSDVK